MSSQIGKNVVFYQCTLLKVSTDMARSIVIKEFTFAVFECRWLNNMIQHLNTGKNTMFIVAGVCVCGMMSFLAFFFIFHGIYIQIGYHC